MSQQPRFRLFSFLIVAGLCGIATVIGMQAGDSSAQGNESVAGQRALKVAVVDIFDVIESSQVFADLKAKHEDTMRMIYGEQQDALNKELLEKREAMKEEEIAGQDNLVDKYQVEIEQIKERLAALKENADRTRAQFESYVISATFAAALIKIEEYAESYNYDMIFRRVNLSIEEKTDSNGAFKLQAQNLFSQRVSDAALIYHRGPSNPNYAVEDITSAINTQMKRLPWSAVEKRVKKRLNLTSAAEGAGESSTTSAEGSGE